MNSQLKGKFITANTFLKKRDIDNRESA